MAAYKDFCMTIEILFYTGFETYKKIYFAYLTLCPMINKIQYYGSNVINISLEDQFFLTMIKLRQDKCNFELSRFFNGSPTTVSNIFITFINFVHQGWSQIDTYMARTRFSTILHTSQF